MSMIAWREEYSVEIQEIDEQHKCLVKLINKLYDGLAAKKNREEIGEVLDDLVDYTRVHFAVEECLMRMFGYPDYEEHKAVHDDIAQKVHRFHDQWKGGDDAVGMELLSFLKGWLVNHINESDKAYAPHLTKHGAKRKWLRKFW